jgi:hypothetical protein
MTPRNAIYLAVVLLLAVGCSRTDQPVEVADSRRIASSGEQGIACDSVPAGTMRTRHQPFTVCEASGAEQRLAFITDSAGLLLSLNRIWYVAPRDAHNAFEELASSAIRIWGDGAPWCENEHDGLGRTWSRSGFHVLAAADSVTGAMRLTYSVEEFECSPRARQEH